MRARKLGVAVLAALGMVFGLGLMASAHTDSGVDETWTEAMNQETYWETRFGPGATCTKFNNHPGTGVGSYEAVVTKGGTMVRVYHPNTESTVTGPVNTAAPQHNHFEISWVMKCNIEDIPDETTTTTLTEETTTTVTDETTTTTEVVDETTTTLGEQTTTTLGETTTTLAVRYDCSTEGELIEVNPGDPGYDLAWPDPSVLTCADEVTTTTAPTPTTTAPPADPGDTIEELPFTGIDNAPGLWVTGVLAFLAGLGLVLRAGRKSE